MAEAKEWDYYFMGSWLAQRHPQPEFPKKLLWSSKCFTITPSPGSGTKLAGLRGWGGEWNMSSSIPSLPACLEQKSHLPGG